MNYSDGVVDPSHRSLMSYTNFKDSQQIRDLLENNKLNSEDQNLFQKQFEEFQEEIRKRKGSQGPELELFYQQLIQKGPLKRSFGAHSVEGGDHTDLYSDAMKLGGAVIQIINLYKKK